MATLIGKMVHKGNGSSSPFNSILKSSTGFARKYLFRRRSLAQRRKGAKRYRVSKGFLCAFAREKCFAQRSPGVLSAFHAKRYRVSKVFLCAFAGDQCAFKPAARNCLHTRSTNSLIGG